MKSKVLVACAATAACFLFASLAQAQTYYTDRPTFQAENPGLDLETFDNGTVAPLAVCGGAAPWSNAGGAPCFSAGDLLPSVVYDISGELGSSLQNVSLGAGILGNTSPAIGPDTFVDNAILTFSEPGNDAVGLDVFCNEQATLTVEISGTGGLIDSTTVNCNPVAPTFFGVAAGEQITQIEFDDGGGGIGEILEDLEFTSGTGEGPPARATFAVWKDFDDDNPAEVLVTLTCNTGLPLQQSKLITDNDANPEPVRAADGFFVGAPPVNFVVVDYNDGEMDCEITEEVPAGYDADYFDGSETNDISCAYEGVAHGEANVCQITNSLQAVEVEVTKVWIDETPQFGAQNVADADWFCNNVAGGGSEVGFLQFFGNPGVDSFFVSPDWETGTTCSITEVALNESGVEVDDSECDGLVVFPGAGASCTIFNTRLFEGIPTLSQYGLAMLALLMLGVGFVAFRRLI